MSHPVIRTYIRQQLVKLIQEEYGSTALIAGVATAGIPQGVLVAQELGLPFVYVRSTPKGHGMQNLVEGEVVPGQRTIVVEDLISTGKSSIQAIEALRKVEAEVVGLVSIFSYGFEVAANNFLKAKCRFSSLSNYDKLLDQAVEGGYINKTDLRLLQLWRADPENWTPEI